MGQQRILLRLVEAVDLIDEQQRTPVTVTLLDLLCPFDGTADVLDPREYRGEAYEFGIGITGDQPCQGGLAAVRAGQ